MEDILTEERRKKTMSIASTIVHKIKLITAESIWNLFFCEMFVFALWFGWQKSDELMEQLTHWLTEQLTETMKRLIDGLKDRTEWLTGWIWDLTVHTPLHVSVSVKRSAGAEVARTPRACLLAMWRRTDKHWKSHFLKNKKIKVGGEKPPGNALYLGWKLLNVKFQSTEGLYFFSKCCK